VKLSPFFLVSSLLIDHVFASSDGFSGIQCGSDIAKALVGKHISKRLSILKKGTPISPSKIWEQQKFLGASRASRG